MNSGYLYILQQDDTLKNVAKGLGLTSFEITGYHNTNCGPNEKITGSGLPPGLEYLLLRNIPSDISDKYKDLIIEKKQIPLYNNRLLFRPLKDPKHYGTTITIGNGTKQNTIKYTTCVQLTDDFTQDGQYVFELFRTSKVFINDEEANDLADELAAKSAQVLFPIKITVADTGEWTGIYNYKEIVNRWQETKTRITKEYTGETVDQYLTLCERTIRDEEVLYRCLQQDLFLKSFFSKIYVSYPSELYIDTLVGFPIIENTKEVRYRVTQQVAKYLNKYNEISIRFDGEIKETRSKEDLENGLNFSYYGKTKKEAQKAEGSFSAKYFLNGSSCAIEALYMCCSLDLDEPKKIEISTALTDPPASNDDFSETIKKADI